jgi:hypothetical protein
MWTFNSSNGALAHDGALVTVLGWSGHDEGRNNPRLEDEPDIGPIPRGVWEIGPVFDSETHGPVAMRLAPAEDTKTFGRGGFLIHGASILNPGESSKGCIILPRTVRLEIAGSDDKMLEVV